MSNIGQGNDGLGVLPGGGTDVSDATAQQYHIKSGKTAYIATGKVTGNAYTPSMMQLDGSTGYYSATATTAGNKVTVIARFKAASYTGGTLGYIGHVRIASGARLEILTVSSDYVTTAWRDTVLVASRDSSNVLKCLLFSPIGYLDNELHTVMFSFDGDAGTAQFIIDGAVADDIGNAARIAPSVSTMSTGSASVLVGASYTGANVLNGQLGFFGYRDAYLTNWSDFMHPDGSPKALDESTWTEWGAQPLFWNEHGDMENNLGSAGAMTKNGTIVVGKGGN